MSREIPCISDKLMKQVEAIFAHGPQRAKSHDQRFGQWLVNKIRTQYSDECKGYTTPDEQITKILFNMENPELYELLRDYND